MAERDSTAGDPLHPHHRHNNLQQQLAELDNRIYQLLCASRFVFSAMQAITQQEEEPGLDQHRHFGLCAICQWLEETGENILRQLKEARQDL